MAVKLWHGAGQQKANALSHKCLRKKEQTKETQRVEFPPAGGQREGRRRKRDTQHVCGKTNRDVAHSPLVPVFPYTGLC